MPGGLTLTEQTVALYAAPTLDGPDVPAMVAAGMSALGGADTVRRRAATWLTLNGGLLGGGLPDTEWRRLVAAWWPDPVRLDRCNALVFAHALTSQRR